MKRFIALTIVLTAVVGLTLTFAGPERTSSKEVMPAPPQPECDWSGFYIGANIGWANFQAKFTDLDYWEGYDTRVLEDVNFTGGGQVGFNWQHDAFVFGIEADAAYLNTDVHTHTTFGQTGSGNNFQDDNAELNFLGTLRGRAGLAYHNALIYVTAGLAYAHGEWEERYVAEPPSEEVTTWTGDDWRWGWTAGVGAEYMLNCHWTVRLETLYTNLEDDTVHGHLVAGEDTENSNFRYQFDDELWTVRLGVNYKFGGFFGR
jgi:outer membrane immunogenic protein